MSIFGPVFSGIDSMEGDSWLPLRHVSQRATSFHMQSPETILDLTGLACPYVAIETKKVLSGLPLGAVLVVKTTDPVGPLDLHVMCEALGHRVEGTIELASWTETTI